METGLDGGAGAHHQNGEGGGAGAEVQHAAPLVLVHSGEAVLPERLLVLGLGQGEEEEQEGGSQGPGQVIATLQQDTE